MKKKSNWSTYTPPQNARACIYRPVLLSQALCRALENCPVRNPAEQYRNTFAKRALRAQRRGRFFLRHLGWVSGRGKNPPTQGAWVAQWVKASAFGSGHDLRSPASGLCSTGSLLPPLSLPASLPTCDLCQINK